MRLDYLARSRARRTNTCHGCGTSFQPPSGHPRQKFCSRACAGKYIIAHRKRKSCRMMICLVCEKEFRPSWYGRKTCSRTCAHIRGSPRRQKLEPVRAPEGMLVQGSAPLCCGEVPFFATDFLGRTVVICRRCGERPVDVFRKAGQPLYPQRQDFDDELDAKFVSASTPIAKKVSEYVGDAFRQESHKRSGMGIHVWSRRGVPKAPTEQVEAARKKVRGRGSKGLAA